MNLIFFGTPETSVPFLEALIKEENVAGVVTRPDKPAKRGLEIQKSPIKVLAERRGLPVLQPSNLKDPSFLSGISELKPEAAVVVAYGRILPPEVIAKFPKGIYNIHFSLLPELRGAAPIQWAILNGLSKTGVCSFKIAETLDTGEIFSRRETGIGPRETAVSLEEKLIPLGLETLKETLEKVKSGNQGVPQKGPATSAPLLKKEDGRIDWKEPADDIDRKVRALIRMGASCEAPKGGVLKILSAQPDAKGGDGAPGAILRIEAGRGFLVKCGLGGIWVLRVRPEGKKEMDAWSYLQGHRLKPGDRIS